jgi:hypothetical protein
MRYNEDGSIERRQRRCQGCDCVKVKMGGDFVQDKEMRWIP